MCKVLGGCSCTVSQLGLVRDGPQALVPRMKRTFQSVRISATVGIVKGGPGTGKSVVALNLLGELSTRNLNAHYVTGSKAFTTTVREIFGTRAAQQIKYFNSYAAAECNDIDVMVCDEAHRIRATSNSLFTPSAKWSKLPQIGELIKASKTSVFFIGDDQVVRLGEVGSATYVSDFANQDGCNVYEYQLEAQFRCAGSDGFVNWINNTLQVQRIFSPSPCALSKNFLFLPTNRIGRQTRAHLAGRFATDSARQAERLNGFTFPSEKNPDWWLAAERLGPNQGTWSFR